ncbi:hypothetical protein N0V82_009234 [Gnomoniopsis sp. IMI 355080]|nr:hypothetical protein N0V82_009234 [Gnomoniopsis sp. IMI 355080]
METETTTNTAAREEQALTLSPRKDDKTALPEKGSSGLTFNPLRFGIATVVAAISVLLVFLANQVYLFGSTFNQASRNHAFTIAAVNYDGDNSTVWKAFSEAYAALASDTFATVIWISDPVSSDFPTSNLLVDAVRDKVAAYNPADAVAYVWNEIRYPAVSASVVKPGVLQLQAVAQSIYQAGAIATVLRGATGLHPQTAVSAYVSPFNATEINVSPAPQAEKAFYNTIIMAMGIVQQNIFLIAFMGMSKGMALFNQPFKVSGTWALTVGLVFTFMGSLVTTGFIWAFRETWAVSNIQFFLTWMSLWLVHHIYYQLIDGTLSLIPIQIYSFIVVTWVFLNITSTVFPLEYSPGFYTWGQALPAYQVLQLLNKRLDQKLR